MSITAGAFCTISVTVLYVQGVYTDLCGFPVCKQRCVCVLRAREIESGCTGHVWQVLLDPRDHSVLAWLLLTGWKVGHCHAVMSHFSALLELQGRGPLGGELESLWNNNRESAWKATVVRAVSHRQSNETFFTPCGLPRPKSGSYTLWDRGTSPCNWIGSLCTVAEIIMDMITPAVVLLLTIPNYFLPGTGFEAWGEGVLLANQSQLSNLASSVQYW